MKKKLLFLLIAIVTCGVLSVLAEVFIFNFKPLALSDSERSIPQVSYSTEQSDDTTIIKLDLSNQYIRELLIQYSTSEDVDYQINYTYSGTYGLDTDKSFDDIFDNSFGVSATNIDATVSQMSISYDNSSDLQISQIIIDNDFHFNYFRACFIFLALLAICLLFLFYKDGFRTEKIHIYFAVICSLLGLMIITAQPAMNFYCWDDQTHFDRVVSLPIGTQEYTIGEFNMSDSGTINHTWHESTDSFTEHRIRSSYLDSVGDTTYTGNPNTTFLSIHKIPYIPMATGYHLAKFIGLPFTICFQIGKIFNLLFYVLLMTYAIKKLVTGKRLLAIIALLPSSIFLASEYSYDPAVFAGITIFIVHIINLLLDKTTKFDFKTALIMIISMTYACLAKAAYAPILLLTLLIPKEKFANLKQSRLIKVGFIAITILLGGTLLLSSLDGANLSDTRGGEVSVKDQLSLVVSHPMDYASVLSDTAVEEFNYKLFSHNTITNFSYTGIASVQQNFYYIFFILLIFVFLTDNKGNKLTKKQRLGFLGISLLVILVIWTALYLDFTPVGLSTINGVQNRYFLPLLLPILFALQIPSIQNKINPKYYNLIIFALAALFMIFMIYELILLPYNF